MQNFVFSLMNSTFSVKVRNIKAKDKKLYHTIKEKYPDFVQLENIDKFMFPNCAKCQYYTTIIHSYIIYAAVIINYFEVTNNAICLDTLSNLSINAMINVS